MPIESFQRLTRDALLSHLIRTKSLVEELTESRNVKPKHASATIVAFPRSSQNIVPKEPSVAMAFLGLDAFPSAS